mgnify:FL=1
MRDYDRIRAALSFICPDDRDVWVRMGMAVKAELGADGFDLWDEWSRLSDGYQPAAAKAVWKSFKSGLISAGSLFHAARLAGWQDDVEHAKPSAEEIEQRRARRAALAESERAERERRAQIAAMRAGALWRSALKDGVSPYLARKQVEAESIKFLPDGSLVVPMIRYDLPRESALVGAQVIAPNGEKRFTPGTAKQGSACRLGLVEVGAVILLCEGLATGLTIRMALNNRFAVFVAFDAGNLRPVAELLRALYPASPLLVCADDDWQTKGNPGVTKATETTKRVPYAHLIYPVFTGKRGAKDTDFNDLQAASGLVTVAREFQGPLAYMGRLSVRAPEVLSHAA